MSQNELQALMEALREAMLREEDLKDRLNELNNAALECEEKLDETRNSIRTLNRIIVSSL